MASVVQTVAADEEAPVSSVTLPAVNAGGGNLVYVFQGWRTDAAQTAGVPQYGGSPAGFTLAASLVNDISSAQLDIYVGRGLAGTQDIVTQWSAPSPSIMARAFVVADGDTGTPNDAVVSRNTNTPSASDVATATGLFLEALLIRNDDILTAGASQQNTLRLGSGTGTDMWSSTQPAGVAQTLSWSGNISGDRWIHAIVPVRQSAGGGGTKIPQIVHHLREQGIAA
jgi:hypothetical protein